MLKATRNEALLKRLRETSENIEDARIIEQTKKTNGNKPRIPWSQIKKDLYWTLILNYLNRMSIQYKRANWMIRLSPAKILSRALFLPSLPYGAIQNYCRLFLLEYLYTRKFQTNNGRQSFVG